MSGSFVPTGSFTNLTRLELEQLRKADFGVAGKSLTTGDATGSNADVNAELFASNPAMALADIITVRPPTNPYDFLGTVTQVAQDSAGANIPSSTVQWFGPKLIAKGIGNAISTNVWNTVTSISGAGVLPGDILIVKSTPGNTALNDYATSVITSVLTSTSVQVSNIRNPGHSPTTEFGSGDVFLWLIIRPQVIQLYAVPGSGPPGQEQAFMFVKPVAQNSGVHALGAIDNSVLATLTAQRIKNIVPPTFAARPGDRSDAVYTTAGGALNALGYRVIFFPDDGTGTGPDLTHPIAAINPLIDGTIPATDQRVTIDYAAGVVRMSTPPTASGEFKRGVNPATSRMNLYATFWAVDSSVSGGSATGLFFARGDIGTELPPAKVVWNEGTASWYVDHGAISNSTPLTLAAGPGFTQLSTLTQFANETSWEPLLKDPSFEFVPAVSNVIQDSKGPWVYTPNPGAAVWNTAPGFSAGTSVRMLSSATGTVGYQLAQTLLVQARPGQKVRFKVDYRPVGTPTTNTQIQFGLSARPLDLSTLSYQLTPIQTLNAGAGGVLTLEGTLVVTPNQSWITELQLNIVQISGPGGNTPTFDFDNFQVYLEPQSSQDHRGLHREVTTPTVTFLKFANDPYATSGVAAGGQDATLSYNPASATVRLGRFDDTDTLANTPPTFEQRGQMQVGAGLLDATVAKQVFETQALLTDLSNIDQTRTLLWQSGPTSYPSRCYSSRALTGGVSSVTQTNVASETTINAVWDPTTARWAKDVGAFSSSAIHVVSEAGLTVGGTQTLRHYGGTFTNLGDRNYYGKSGTSIGYTGRYIRRNQNANWTSGGTVLTLAGGYASLLAYPPVQVGDVLYTYGPSATSNFRYYISAVTSNTITISAVPGGNPLVGHITESTFFDTGVSASSHYIEIAPAEYFQDRTTDRLFQRLTPDSLVTITTGSSKFTSTSGADVTITDIQEGDRIESVGTMMQDIVGTGSGSLQAIFGAFRYKYLLNGSTITTDGGDASASFGYETGISGLDNQRLVIDITIRSSFVCTKDMELAGSVVVSAYAYTNSGTPNPRFILRNHRHTLVRRV